MPNPPNALALLCAGTLLLAALAAPSAAAEAVLPSAPAAPVIGLATAGDHAAVVRWTPPVRDGGAPILEYVITQAGTDTTVHAAPAATSARVARLVNGAAARFRVAAVNALGAGTPSEASAVVMPRGPVSLRVLRQPERRATYGTHSTVVAAMARPDGTTPASQRVELHAKMQPTSRWREVAAAVTGTGGQATLRVPLPASAALRLHHPPSNLAARTDGAAPVVVAKKITAAVARTHTRMGTTILVRGRVAPVQRTGTPVYLQRRVAGSWKRLAAGRMGAQGRYLIGWSPPSIGRYALRTVVPRNAARAAGSSHGWWQRVSPETTADVATDILRDRGMTLATVHLSSGSDRATPRRNIVDVANGRRAYTSCFGSAPCHSTHLDRRMLRAVREMGARATLTVSEFAGGSHAGRSAHYHGRGVDITWVNGEHVGRGASYGMVVDLCRAFGAAQIFTPANDPWGGHSTHVHCGWD